MVLGAGIVVWTTAPVGQRVRSSDDTGDERTDEPTTTGPPDAAISVAADENPDRLPMGNADGAGGDERSDTDDPTTTGDGNAGDGDGDGDGDEADGGGDDAGGDADGDGDPDPGSTTDPAGETAGPIQADVQADVTPIPVLDPRNFGAIGDGVADDTEALQRTVDAAGDGGGGIVYIADGVTYRTTDVVLISDDNVHLWARSGRGAILADTGGRRVSQAIMCQDNDGCGVHGVRFRSTAVRRLSAKEDSQIVLDGTSGGEVVGNEIQGSASAAIFVYGRSSDVHVEGNYVHDSWSDSVHFTGGSRRAWVWDNTFYTPTPGKGDDGIACVTYGDSARCGEMEWWRNTHLGSGWGRAFAVVGGEDITIHHNYAQNIAAAGVLVASEPSYDTPGSRSITIHDNALIATGQTVPHPGILVSGLSATISDVSIRNNVVVDSANGEATRTEGDLRSVQVATTSTSADRLPQPEPAIGDAAAKPTDTLKLRDRSFVDADYRSGLHRTLVSASSSGTFGQRYEYVLAGPPALVDDWSQAIGAGQPQASAIVEGEQISVVVSPVPARLPAGTRAVSFAEVRRLDNTGVAPGIWASLNG